MNWCRRRDLNPHGLRHTPLKRACLPFHHFGPSGTLKMPFNFVLGRLLHCDVTTAYVSFAGLPAASFKGILSVPEKLQCSYYRGSGIIEVG